MTMPSAVSVSVYHYQWVWISCVVHAFLIVTLSNKTFNLFSSTPICLLCVCSIARSVLITHQVLLPISNIHSPPIELDIYTVLAISLVWCK